MNFIEKGYEFVLDADITPGEQSDGTHKVFVEIERTNHIHKQVMEVMDGVSKLTGLREDLLLNNTLNAGMFQDPSSKEVSIKVCS